MKQKKISS